MLLENIFTSAHEDGRFIMGYEDHSFKKDRLHVFEIESLPQWCSLLGIDPSSPINQKSLVRFADPYLFFDYQYFFFFCLKIISISRSYNRKADYLAETSRVISECFYVNITLPIWATNCKVIF